MAILILIIIGIFSLNYLKAELDESKKFNLGILERIKFLKSISDNDLPVNSIYSGNLGSFLNNSSNNKNINIDRSMPLANGDISIWINEVRFNDLFEWLVEINGQGGEISKMSIRRSSKELVSAQITFKDNT
jgi:type II secretory pathway component PulM